MARKIIFGYEQTYAPDSSEGQRILKIMSWVGVVILVIGIVLSLAYLQITDELVEVEAVITGIRGSGDDRRVYVTYTCGGVRYKNVPLSYSSPGMRVGGALTIRVHPDDPGDPTSNAGPVFLFMGAIFLAVTQAGKHIAKRQGAKT